MMKYHGLGHIVQRLLAHITVWVMQPVQWYGNGHGGYSNPSSSQVDTYLSGKGYSKSGNWAQIVSYGWSSNITHFSKVTGTEWSRAKWGSLERFNHNSWDPYYHNSVYGPQVQIYYQ